MQATLIYGAGVGITMAFFLLLRILDFIRAVLYKPALVGWTSKYLFSRLWYHSRFPAPNRLGVGLQILYWAGTAVYNVWGVHSLQDGSARAICLASLNVVPLMLADRCESLANILGTRVTTWRNIHGSIGVMTIAQAAIHLTLWILEHGIQWHNASDMFGVGVLATLLASLCCFIPSLRRHCYEFVSFAHTLFALGVIFCLSMRLGFKLTQPHIFLAAGLACYVFSKVLRLARILWRSFTLSRGWSSAVITQKSGATRLTITPSEPFRVQAGQYVYLWLPGLSVFQTHPFVIAWWDEDRHGRATSFEIIVKTRAGLTKRLSDLVQVSRLNIAVGELYEKKPPGLDATPVGPRLNVAVDGPYGYCPDISKYGTLVLVATSIGIAAQFAVLRRAMLEYKADTTCVRRISVIWQSDDEIEQFWIIDWLDTLIDEIGEIIHFQQYVTGQPLQDTDIPGKMKEYRERVKKVYSFVDIEQAIDEELPRARGKVLILAATDTRMRNRLRKRSLSLDFRRTDYVEMDFQPEKRQHFWRRNDVPFQKVINVD